MEIYKEYLNKVKDYSELLGEFYTYIFNNNTYDFEELAQNNKKLTIFLLPLLLIATAENKNKEVIRLLLTLALEFKNLSFSEYKLLFSISYLVWESAFKAIINSFSDQEVKRIFDGLVSAINFGYLFPVMKGLILALMNIDPNRNFSLVNIHGKLGINLDIFVHVLKSESAEHELLPEKVYAGFKFLFPKKELFTFLTKLKNISNFSKISQYLELFLL